MRIRAMVMMGALLALSGCNDRDDTDAGTDSGGIDGGDMDGGGGENTAALCSDMMDNDGNGFADCNDFSCCSLVTCGAETTCGMRPDSGPCVMGAEDTMAACTDGCDNDGNTFADCRDFSCSAFCGAENSNTACIDGMDNDDDGFTDCMDNDCMDRVVCGGEATNANCSDMMDNDGDGAMDCADTDCQDEAIVVCSGSTPTGVAESMWVALVATACTNGTDDDGDDRFDCGEFSCLWNHPGCVAPPREATNALCSDAGGLDEDMDGLVNCDDPGCQEEGIVVCDGTTPVVVAPGDYQTMSTAVCTDGMGHMDDAFDDCADFSCSHNPDVVGCENTDAECMDGVNNMDGDAFIDCMDNSCSQNPFVTVCARESSFAECGDGMDNDMNGFADCRDNACNGTFGPASANCIDAPTP